MEPGMKMADNVFRCPPKICSIVSLLRGLSLHLVVGQREPGLITISSVLVQYALGDGGINCRQSRVQKISCSGGVSCSNSGTQTLHDAADACTIGAVHFGTLTRLRRTL